MRLPYRRKNSAPTRAAVLNCVETLERRTFLSSVPLNGVPAAVPGTIQFENFDTGGEGVAYHDTTAANQGGQYRNEGVDLGAAADPGAGYFVGWTNPGEWENYTVNVGAGGNYAVALRVANGGAGGTFHINVDGVNATGSIQMPLTGGWQNWTTISAPKLALGAGNHVLTLSIDSGAQGMGNFNYMTLTAVPGGTNTPFQGTPQAIPGTLQFENFDSGGEGIAYHDTSAANEGGQYRNEGVDLGAASDAGGGFFVGWTNPGEWDKYTVNVATSATYSLALRMANGGAGGSFHINVDGVNATGAVNMPGTGGWQNWATINLPSLSLSAGAHVLTLSIDSGAQGMGNFNYLTFGTTQAPPPANSTPFQGQPQGVPGTIEFENYDAGGEGVAYHDTSAPNEGGIYRNDAVDLSAANDPGGTAFVGWTNPGEWLKYTVNVASSTLYSLAIRVANGGAGGSFHINVDGVNQTGALTMPYTGGWQNWTTLNVNNVPISAGTHVLTLMIDSGTQGIGNFNWMAINDNPATSPRTQWWRDSKYGMFIHWGLYSQLAGHWNGQTTSGFGEWIMNDLNIPLSQYSTVAAQFNPTQFSAAQWVQTAKDAGMQYIVLTSKHHEGFSMFNTSVNNYNSVADTPWHQDAVAQLSTAAHAAGLHFGAYYSILNWADPNASAAGINTYMQTMETQLKELIVNDHVDVLWFDGEWPDWWTSERGRELNEYVRNLNPSLIINNRIGKRLSTEGDYDTPEGVIPTNEPAGRLWETAMTLNDTWGYKDTDNNWKSPTTIIDDLATIVGGGGNYLLNVGPTGAGVIPSGATNVLQQVGTWLKTNGSAIYGTTQAPLSQQPWGVLTRKGNTLYAIVTNWPTNGILHVGIKGTVTGASILSNGQSLSFATNSTGVDINVPTMMPQQPATVVQINYSGGMSA
jgi:alpha-L-fucosidase